MRVVLGRTVAAALLACVLAVAARPSQDGLFSLDDSRRPIYRGNLRTRASKSDAEVIVKSDISVMGAEDGRAVSPKPTSATPIAESLKMVTNQLLQAPMATDMVATDVRTPPRVKNQHRIEESSYVKGEAIPVIMGNKVSQEAVSNTPKTTTHSSSDGISTWILLSSDDQSKLTTKKKPETSTISLNKKPIFSTTTENINKNLNETFKVERKPISVKPIQNFAKKPNVTKEEFAKIPPITLHDSKFKNRTPVIVGRIPSVPKNKTENLINKKSSTAAQSQTTKTEELSEIQKPTTPTPNFITPKVSLDIVPTTSLVIKTDTIELSEDSSTTEPPNTTTKRTRRPGNKKKKKNKNRRRRPTKTDSSQLESKVTPENNSNNSKVEGHPNRPLSTRIYNYLAREVMPNVGVGIVGLVLTAGLAGLLLYPFGGGIARRNYDKVSGPSPDGHMYYYNDYTPGVDLDQGNVQAEETVFGQVLSGMNQNNYGNRYEPQKFNTNKYRYDTVDYNSGNVNGYAGSNEYSTLPDSIKNADYSTIPENTKYYNMEPMSPQYKSTENLAEVDKYSAVDTKYPSLTEYAAYSNAASVGTSGTYENVRTFNKSEMTEEDKSDKSQPQFSALVGSPQFNDFVGSVAVSGSYGTEVRHRSGALALEHGPRSLEVKSRKVRATTDDSVNEIDDSDDKFSKYSTMAQEETTEGSVLSSTDMPDHGSVESVKDETTTPQIETTTNKIQEEEFSLMELFRKVAQAKLKIGIAFLRSTSETFQRYFDRITTKMETAVRNLDKNSTTANDNLRTFEVPKYRGRREVRKPVKKRHYSKKYKHH